MWEFRLPHVLKRFVGTNFPTEVILLNNLRTYILTLRYITLRTTSSIIPCRNASCNILRMCFNGSEMTTCLTHDQIKNKRKMPILSEETFLDRVKLSKKNFQRRSLNTCAASSNQSPNFRGLFTSRVT